MNTKAIIAGLIVFGLLIVSSSMFYIVDETQQVIITQFGDPVGDAITDPGLHWKVPFIQTANYFDRRFLEWDGLANQVPTRDKRFIWVDTYARWRISDPLLFFQRVTDERGAQTRLDDILDGETRNAVARHDLVEVVRTSNRDPDSVQVDIDSDEAVLAQIQVGRSAITEEIHEAAQRRATDLGIEILDLRFKRINYVDEVRRDVFNRMIAERNRIAERYRSEGEGESARIDGERERELQRIQSEAYRTAQEISGVADAEATRIYAEAYNLDPEFYAFIKSLETYELTADESTIMILTTDSDLLRFLKTKR